MAMTYSSLITEVSDYLNRVDASLLNRIPDFITQAQITLADKENLLGFQTTSFGNLEIGTEKIPKPVRWRRNVSWYLKDEDTGLRVPLLIRTLDYLRLYSPLGENSVGFPIYYSDYDYSYFLIAPAPDQAYYFEQTYKESLEPLSLTNQQNWLTTFAPKLLLSATLLETPDYLKDDERIAVWKSVYDEQLKDLTTQNQKRYQDRFTQRELE